jgi:hypothetical protein
LVALSKTNPFNTAKLFAKQEFAGVFDYTEGLENFAYYSEYSREGINIESKGFRKNKRR